MVFGRNKNSTKSSGSVAVESTRDTSPVETPSESSSKYTPPKGRPTPSRKQQVAARKQPLVPTDRKAAKEADRDAAREQRKLENIALQTGDERYLPVRDRGAQRRYIRDFVDARFNVGDFMIVVLIAIFVIGMFAHNAQLFSTILMWSLLLIWALDTWLMWRKLKKRLLAKFGNLEPGAGMYAFNRVMMLRRFRLPKPQVKRGQYPQ